MATVHAAAFTQSRPWTASEFSDFLNQTYCFAVGDTRCFALLRTIADECEVLTIATHPDHQQQGLATAIMAKWVPVAQNRGATRAFLEVAADNAAGIALYAKTGFIPCGRRPGYYQRKGQDSVDAVLMTCDLTQG